MFGSNQGGSILGVRCRGRPSLRPKAVPPEGLWHRVIGRSHFRITSLLESTLVCREGRVRRGLTNRLAADLALASLVLDKSGS